MLMVLVALTFTGCGYDKSNGEREESLSFSKSALSGGAPLEDSEMAVALRVCYGFRTKRSKFLAEMLDESFNFVYEYRNCDSSGGGNSYTAQLTQGTSNDPMTFESSFSGNYIKEVQTDLNGFLSDICADVLAGETPLSIAEIDNELYEYRFSSSTADGDKVSITIGSKKYVNASTPSVSQKLVFNILTNATSSGNYQGMIYEATRYLPCESGDKESSRYYKQVFKAP